MDGTLGDRGVSQDLSKPIGIAVPSAAAASSPPLGPPPPLSLSFKAIKYEVPIDRKRAREDERERKRKELERRGTAGQQTDGFWKRTQNWFKELGGSCAGSGKGQQPKYFEVLHGISGIFEPGHLAGIMGPSGSGKSSLLDVLAGRNKVGKVSGTVSLSSVDLSTVPPAVLQSMAGYVMQDDAFLANLTVRETLIFALRLRVHEKLLTPELISSTIDSLLTLLNLSSVASSRVGSPERRGISGGERRRLSIGCELVTRPPLVFLDEPTSGLDAGNALRVMRLLRRLATHGHTIIASIHQPRSSIFRMFDELLIMDHGREAYFGPGGDTCVENLEGFTGKQCAKWENPGDWVVDLLEDAELEAEDETESETTVMGPVVGTTSKEATELAEVVTPVISSAAGTPTGATELVPSANTNTNGNGTLPSLNGITGTGSFGSTKIPDAYAASDLYACLQSQLDTLSGSASDLSQPIPRPSFGTLLKVLTHRNALQTLRDPGIVYIRTGAALAIGILVGLIFLQQDQAVEAGRVNALLFLMCVFGLFCLPAISQLISERLLFQRERASGLVNTPAFYLAGMAIEVPILIVVAMLYGVVSYWMVGFYPDAAHFFIYCLIITLTILVGFSATQVAAALSSSVPIAVATYMIILVVSLLLGGFIIAKRELPAGAQWLVYVSYFWWGFSGLMLNEFGDRPYGPALLERMGMGGQSVWTSVGVLVGFFVLFRSIAFVLLLTLHKERR